MSAESRSSSPGRLPSLARAERIEIVALALLAIVPIVPYLAQILGLGIPRFDLAADFALQEYDVRRVWSGETLLGLGSRWRWSHPGPLLFYFIAPFQKIFGTSSTGLYVGTWALSASSAAVSVAATRKWAGRPHAISALIVIVCWFGAFGNIAHNPWVRMVLALPLFAYVVLAALFARGAPGAAIAAVPFGSVVAQTHVLTIETVGVVGVAALVAFVLSARRRGGLTRADKRCLLLAIGLVVILFLPPIIEQVRAKAGEGNVDRLIAFQRTRTGTSKPLGDAFRNWTFANSWLVDRILSGSMLEEGEVPMVMRWDPVPASVSRTAWTILTVQLVASVAAAIVAYRRRDPASLALLGLGALGCLVGIHSVRAMARQEHYSLLFWTVAPSAVAWIGVGATCASELWRAASASLAPSRVGLSILVTLGFVPVLACTAAQRGWLKRHPAVTGTHPHHRPFHLAVYEAVRERAARDNAVPVIHQDGAWADAYSVLLEYDKDGADVRIADVDAWVLPGEHRAREGRFVHFWLASPEWPLAVAPCLSLVTKVWFHSLYASPVDVVTCDAPK
jgi:hypothetical protein